MSVYFKCTCLSNVILLLCSVAINLIFSNKSMSTISNYGNGDSTWTCLEANQVCLVAGRRYWCKFSSTDSEDRTACSITRSVCNETSFGATWLKPDHCRENNKQRKSFLHVEMPLILCGNANSTQSAKSF